MEAIDALSLPPGFGFHPTDVELISYYLRRKNLGGKIEFEVIPEVDVYSYEPWDLPEKSQIPTRYCKWHFFTSRNRKYQNGYRSNRMTESGYWKSTGKDRNIRSNTRIIGTKKTLVFHEGRSPYGKRTDWIMHEYYLHENKCEKTLRKDTFVLCRVTKRNGLTKEDEEVLCAQTQKNVDPCAPLPSKNFQKELDDVTVHPALKEEASSAPENVVDFEAWLTELYDPNFVMYPLDEPKREQKVDPGSLTLEHDLKEQCFSGNLIEEADISVPEEHIPHGNMGYKYNDHEIDGSVFGQSIYGAADAIYTNQLEAEDSENHFLYPGYVAGCVVDDLPTKLLMSSVGMLDRNGKIVPEDDEERIAASSPSPGNASTVGTGIQIRERHCRPFNEIPSHHRIRLQVHKMESTNPEPINQTFMLLSKDGHLDSFCEDSAPVLTKPHPDLSGGFIDRHQITDQVQEMLTYEKSCSALISSHADLKSQENISVSRKLEVVSPKAVCEVASVDASMMPTRHCRKWLQPFRPGKFSLEYNNHISQAYRFLRGVGSLLCKCSSTGLHCLVLVACMIGTAALISMFTVRDMVRF
uniref:NAC domain-containing protein 74 n=1 Tax=Anthurium amnicola TaxID=1678845 RepID=A0A1D1YRE6_9ARAE